jgi:hypothetical protein
LLAKIVENPVRAAVVPGQLRAAQAPWHAAREIARIRVGAIRRRLIGDVDLAAVQPELPDIDIAEVERLEVDVAQCAQHGDLHCANVLFDDRGNPMIIDYPDTGRTLASLDPIALELSTIFHKHAPDRRGWPSMAQARSWPDIAAFSDGASFVQYLRACRDWTFGVAGSEQEVWAVGYTYALRQLKYDDTDKDLARAIIVGCIAALTKSAA